MRSFDRLVVGFCVAAATSLLLVHAAQGDLEMELVRGGRVAAKLDPALEVELFHVRLPKGAKMNASVRGLKPRRQPRTSVDARALGPDGAEVAAGIFRRGTVRLAHEAEESGRYAVEVTSGDGVTGGDYVATIRWRTPRVTRIGEDLGSDPVEIPFVADAGALATFVLRTARRSGARPRLVGIASTDGSFAIDFDPPRDGARQHIVRGMLLPRSGDYVLTVENAATAGGRLTGRVIVRQPPAARRKIIVTSVSEPPEITDLNTGAIGREGGILTPRPPPPGERATLQQTRLSVPPRALTGPTLLQLGVGSEIDDGQPGLTPAGPPAFFGPDGQTFGRPVTITLEFDPARVNAVNDLHVFAQEGDGSISEMAPGDLTVDLGGGRVSLDAVHFTTYQVAGPRFSPRETKLEPPSPQVPEEYGRCVAIDGDTIVVGERTDDVTTDADGSAFVYFRGATGFSLQQKITAPDPSIQDTFGFSCDVDGDTIVVGAPFADPAGGESGSVYVFTRSDDTWTFQQKLVPTANHDAGDQFGESVAVSGDTVLVGALHDDDGAEDGGAVYVYTRSSGVWTQKQKLTAPNVSAGIQFGRWVSLDGGTAVLAGFPDAGSGRGIVHVYERSTGSFGHQQELVPDDGDGNLFGFVVDVSGDAAIVTAFRDGEAGFGKGAAYVFSRSGSTWTQQQKILPPAGAPGEFGHGVSIDGGLAVVGAWGGFPPTVQGKAYSYALTGATWTLVQEIAASDTTSPDNFGEVTGVSRGTAVVGRFRFAGGSAFVYEGVDKRP